MATVTSKGEVYEDHTDLVGLVFDTDPRSGADTLVLRNLSGMGSNHLTLVGLIQQDLIALRTALDALIVWNEGEHDAEDEHYYSDQD